MAYDYSELAEQAKHWATQAVNGNWLDQNQASCLFDVDQRTLHSAFFAENSRPLMVAFMGGTGVGKSTLLNRLAGADIAKMGVERPTSREVTLYYHHSLVIHQLPDALPLQKIKTAHHQDEAKKNIIWLDMPDFDSVEQSNKDLVFQWLPYIDVLVYVVSPERYRDNKAWRVLLAEGSRHGWLFVLNQWDKGDSLQFDDFKQQLSKAGFNNPLIFRTISIPSQQADEFDALLGTIESLATENSIKQLEQRGLQVRKDHLQQQLQYCANLLGEASQFDELARLWQQQWQTTAVLLQQGVAYPLQRLALRHAQHEVDLTQPQSSAIYLWDDWAQSRFNDALDQLSVHAEHLKIPTAPLRSSLYSVRQKAQQEIHTQTELHCRLALVNPGNALQRGLLKVANVCVILLPLAALSAVGYQVFHGYYQSVLNHSQAYLGADFAIHSLLLILLSWLLPAFIQQKMQPSLEKTALRGLKKGLELALVNIEAQVNDILRSHQQQLQQLQLELNSYIQQCEAPTPTEKINTDSTLARILVN